MARYIDAERMKENIVASQPFKERMCEWIDAQPTADVEPVTHATWIEDGYQDEAYVCSSCGWPEPDEKRREETQYCPCCGAKMEDVDEDVDEKLVEFYRCFCTKFDKFYRYYTKKYGMPPAADSFRKK